MDAKLGGALAAVLLVVVACSDDEDKVAGPTGPTTTGPSVGGGGPGGAGASSSGPGGAGGSTIDDTECVGPAVTGIEVYPAADGMQLEQLVRVGERFAASGGLGFVFFDADGGNASPSPEQVAPNLNVLVSEGNTLGVAAASNAAVQFQRFDADGMAVSIPAGVATDQTNALTVASSSGEALIVWGFNTTLRMRRFTDMDLWEGPAEDIVPFAYRTFMFLDAVARGSDVGIVWTGDPNLGENRTQFVMVSDVGAVGEPIDLFETAQSHNVAQVAATDDGFVVLLNGEPPENRPLLLLLDESGAPTGPAVTLEGARFAYGVASRGDSFAVITGRESGEPQLRAFNLSLEPLDAWVCLGPEHSLSFMPAVTVDGAGYATIFTTDAGAVMLHRTDAAGTGAQ